jgi:hypothetical protein
MRRQLKVKQKQAGRKPKEQERLEKKQRKAYLGNSAGKKKQAALEKKTKGGICDVCPHGSNQAFAEFGLPQDSQALSRG